MLFQKNADGWNIPIASPLPRCLVFRFVTGLVFIKFLCFADLRTSTLCCPPRSSGAYTYPQAFRVSRRGIQFFLTPPFVFYRLSFASISIHLYTLVFGAFFEITNSPTRPCHLSPYRGLLISNFRCWTFHHLQLSAHCQHVSRLCRRGVAESPSNPF